MDLYITIYFALQCHILLIKIVVLDKISNQDLLGIYSNYAFLFVALSLFEFAPSWVKNQKKLLNLSNLNLNFFKKEQFISHNPCVYMMVSFCTKQWYIGKTSRYFNFRILEHIRCGRKHHSFGTKKIYEVMSSVGFENFCFIPVVQGNDLEVSFFEKMFIHRFRPTLNSEFYSSWFKMLPSFIQRNTRWSAKKRNRIKNKKVQGSKALDFFKKFKQPKTTMLNGFSVIGRDGFTIEKSLSLECILSKHNYEIITLRFDSTSKYFNNFESILNMFKPSEVLNFSFWWNNKKYFYDGKYCGFIDDSTEHFVLRNNTFPKPKGFLSLDCVFNMCFVCVCKSTSSPLLKCDSCVRSCCGFTTCCKKYKDRCIESEECVLLNTYGVNNTNKKVNYVKHNLFRKVFKHLLKYDNVTITIDVRKISPNNSYDCKMIQRIATNTIGLRADDWSLNYVLKLFYLSKNFPSYSIKTAAHNKLKLMLKKFNIYSEKIIFKMIYDDSIDIDALKGLLRTIVLNLPLSMDVKVNLAKNSRIIPLSHKKVSDILCNHIKMAKAFTKGKRPDCVCMKTPHTIDNLENFSKDVKRVFDMGGNFVVKGTVDYKNEIWKALRFMIFRYISPLCGKGNLARFSKNMDTITFLRFLGFDSTTIEYIIFSIENLIIKNSTQHFDVNINTVYKVKTELQGFVIIPKDKNINQLMIL